MRLLAGLAVLVMVCGASRSPGALPSADEMKSRSSWLKNHFGSGTATPACSFTYAGRAAGPALAKWQRASSAQAFTDRTLHSTSFTDPQTGLILRCEVTEFREHAAVEWVVYLKIPSATTTR